MEVDISVITLAAGISVNAMMPYLSTAQAPTSSIPAFGSQLVLEPEQPFEGPASFDRSIAGMFRSVRGQQVMLDHDLAALYGVAADEFREMVAQNIDRFAKGSLIMLEPEELEELLSGNQFVPVFDDIPFAFTETGVLIAAFVIGSSQAIVVGTRIIDLFLRMRGIMFHHSDILLRLEQLEKRASGEGAGIQAILDDVKKLFDRPVDRPLNSKADHE